MAELELPPTTTAEEDLRIAEEYRRDMAEKRKTPTPKKQIPQAHA